MSQQLSCPNCGSPIVFGVKFCSNCGAQLHLEMPQQITNAIPVNLEQFSKGKVPYWSEAALRIYVTRAFEYAENSFMSSMWCSWALGGVALFGYDGFGGIPDNLDKAKLTFELGIQAMVSAWFRSWYSQKPHTYEEREDAARVALTNVQTFLEIGKRDTIELYLGFDREFQCLVRDKDPKLPFCYIDMFYQRYWECITGEQIVGWDKLRFPLESHQQFISACRKNKRHNFNDLVVDVMAMWVAIVDASRIMFREFERMQKG
jgi:hypothetical protein